MEEKEFDEEMEGDIVELESEDGETVKFQHVATIDYKGDWYVLFSPVEAIEGVEEDEAVIFKLGTDENGGDVFLPVEDDELLDAVYDEYVKIMEEEDEWECGCEDCSKADGCACKDKPEEECDCDSCTDGREDSCDCGCKEGHEDGCDCGCGDKNCSCH